MARGSACEKQGDPSSSTEEEEETFEDKINRIMESRKLLPTASYFAFTATPKSKTLEIFGEPAPKPDGKIAHLPFHSYSMKQAIQEGFILDVLRYYTPEAAHVDQFVELYLGGAEREKLDPLLDACVAVYKERLDEDGQVNFKIFLS